jgi:hypothetical protein
MGSQRRSRAHLAVAVVVAWGTKATHPMCRRAAVRMYTNLMSLPPVSGRHVWDCCLAGSRHCCVRISRPWHGCRRVQP